MTAGAAVLEQRKTSDQNDSSALFVRKNDTKRESPALLWEEGGFWSPPTLHLEIGPRRTQNKPISARGKEHAWPSWQEVRSGNTDTVHCGHKDSQGLRGLHGSMYTRDAQSLDEPPAIKTLTVLYLG